MGWTFEALAWLRRRRRLSGFSNGLESVDSGEWRGGAWGTGTAQAPVPGKDKTEVFPAQDLDLWFQSRAAGDVISSINIYPAPVPYPVLCWAAPGTR